MQSLTQNLALAHVRLTLHLPTMSTHLFVRLVSLELALERALLFDKCADILIDHVPSFEEFATAIDMLSAHDAFFGEHTGTDWEFSFERRDQSAQIH